MGIQKISNKLYRFRPANSCYFESELIEAVQKHRVWCSPVNQQNDPFESMPALVESPVEDVSALMRQIRAKHGENIAMSGSDMGQIARKLDYNGNQIENLKNRNCPGTPRNNFLASRICM